VPKTLTVTLIASAQAVAESRASDEELSQTAAKLERSARMWTILAWIGGIGHVLVWVITILSTGVLDGPWSKPLRLFFVGSSVLAIFATVKLSKGSGTAEMIRDALAARERFVIDVLTGRPYALYLRDYRSERGRDTGTPYSADVPIGAMETYDGVERSLMATIGARIPIYGLLNAEEPYGGSGVVRIAVGAHWLEHVEGYALHAALIIFSFDSVTAAVLQEIDAIERRGLTQRVFLSVTTKVNEQLLRERASFAGSVRWLTLRGERSAAAEAVVPPGLLDSLPDRRTRTRAIEARHCKDLDNATALAMICLGLTKVPSAAGEDTLVIHVRARPGGTPAAGVIEQPL
jgi:hypothetical protein